jgi:hypothetical protein
LHFDEALLDACRARGIGLAWVTLHVGAGTFQPVRVDDVREHRMHAERYRVPPETEQAIATTRAAGGRIIAVGTTSLRTLESVAAEHDGRVVAGEGETRLFVTPGYRFRVVDRLVTNFHLPRSTLLMLVSAFAGIDTIRKAYAHAIANRYRFFSYGDAMLLDRQPPLLFADDEFRTAGPGRRSPARPAHAQSRLDRHANLHAGRDLRRSQGDVAARTRGGRRADHPRQHLPLVAAAWPGGV